jgi:hypothetical protein
MNRHELTKEVESLRKLTDQNRQLLEEAYRRIEALDAALQTAQDNLHLSKGKTKLEQTRAFLELVKKKYEFYSRAIIH